MIRENTHTSRRFDLRLPSLARALPAVLALCTLAVSTVHAQTKAQIVAASQRAVNYIINDTKRPEVIGCFSCHNTGQAIRAGAMAEKSLSLTVDHPQLNTLVAYVMNQQYLGGGSFDGAVTHVGGNFNLQGFPYTTSSWALFSLIGIDPAVTQTSFTTARLIRGASFMERAMTVNGYPSDHNDGPVSSGNPGETARAVMVLAKAKQSDHQAHWDTAINNGVTYLRNTTPRSQNLYYVQDAAWIVMALSAAGVPPTDAKVAAMVSLLKGCQAADGGWSIGTTAAGISTSDAFGTGVALSALLAAGETNAAAYPAFQHGITWLLGSQVADGGWASAQGHSRVSSSTWAVLSLTELASAPPKITVPANITAEATGPSGAAVTFTVSAIDDAGNNLPVSLSAASGSTFPLGTTTVTARATNADGNTGTKTFTITVVDTTRPVLTLPANLSIEATGPNGAVATFSGSAQDAVSGACAVTFSPASGSTFAIGTTVVTATATDAAGNVGTGVFSVVVKDTTPPVIGPVANITAEATSAAGALVSYPLPTATDALGATVTALPAPGSIFPQGTTTVTVTARDAAGNTSTATFAVTVQDTTAPTITTVSSNLIVEATSAAGALVNYAAATATDAVGVTSLTYSAASGSTFPVGTTTVTVTAKDAAGNTGTKTFTVTVKDTTPPVITATLTARGGGDDESSQFFTLAFSATDLVGVKTLTAVLNGVTVANGQVVQLQTIKSGAQSVKRDDGKLQIKATSFALVVTAKDAAGNTSTKTIVPVFVKNGKDSEDSKGSDDKKGS